MDISCQISDNCAFKFGRRVRFALPRKTLKPPIARLAVIELGLKTRPSGEADCIYEAIVK